jgi:hypothetical protein
LVPFQLYNVDDGTGEITVVSNSGRTPNQGAHVRVKGKVNEVAVFGGRSIGLHLQEEKRRDRLSRGPGTPGLPRYAEILTATAVMSSFWRQPRGSR